MKTIAIVGGGTAGWLTAHQFLRKINPEIKIVVVSSSQVPVIGVGEGTTGLFTELIHELFDEKEFLKETESTYKIGIRHSDWDQVGKSFWSPLGDEYSGESSFPSPDYDDVRVWHIANGLEYDKSFQSRLMAENRLHISNGESIYTKIHEEQDGYSIPVAYHLDSHKVGEYLKRKALEKSNCSHVEGKVVALAQDRDGSIHHLVLDDDREVEADFYIDCSGFSRILINNIVDNNFISYDNDLLVDSALVFTRDSNDIKNYTHAHALKNGWMWEIPTQTRMGCGYTFSSKFTDKDKAYDELGDVEIKKHITFNSGRVEKHWFRNVLSTGLASGFVEPLEAISIHATILQNQEFLDNYFKPSLDLTCDALQEQYNEDVNYMWDNFRDFLVFHYISHRTDTDFWIESSSSERWSPRLTRLMKIWKCRMPRVTDFKIGKSNDFHAMGNPLWYNIAIGMNMLDPLIASQELHDYGIYDVMETRCKNTFDAIEKALPSMVKTNDYYMHI